MSSFLPKKTSSPVRSILKSSLLDVSNDTAASSASAILSGLSSEDVALIDAIVERAPPSTSAFLNIFKAYNDVLQERAMDAGEDVVYYRLLLKLGIMKGKDWKEKWETVKRQMGYGPSTSQVKLNIGKARSEFTLSFADTFSVTTTETDADTVAARSQAYEHARQYHTSQPSEANTPTSNTLGLTLDPFSVTSPDASVKLLPNFSSALRLDAKKAYVPPSHSVPAQVPKDYGYKRPPSKDTATPSRVADPKKPEKAFNEEAAWERIRMIQDEKEADQFREDRLIEKCWNAWREGYGWIITTHQQVDLARKHLILCSYFQKWREAYLISTDSRGAAIYNQRLLKRVWKIWRKKLRLKRVENWKRTMKTNMAHIKTLRARRLKEEAWIKWRQQYRLRQADKYNSSRLITVVFQHWKQRLTQVQFMEHHALEFVQESDRLRQAHHFRKWRYQLSFREKESRISALVTARICRHAFEQWKNQLGKYQRNNDICNSFVTRRYMRKWRTVLLSKKYLERKADRHRTRQEAMLLHAVMHVWIARERAKMLERVREARLVALAWDVWKERQKRLTAMSDKAVAFNNVSSSTLIKTSFNSWHERYNTRQSVTQFAIQYYEDRLLYRSLNTWRINLRLKLRMIKQAKIARRYLLVRHAWTKWRELVHIRQIQKTRRVLELAFVKRMFERWRQSAAKRQYYRYAEETIQRNVSLRIMRGAMQAWTHRVIDLKLREISTKEKLDRQFLSFYFEKWKAASHRRAEELSLMQSYQDIKREELLRRTFHAWLSVARKARHRRMALQQYQQDAQAVLLAAAWDKWRDRLQAKRLEPLEKYSIALSQKNLLFRAFGIWRSKTKTIPAIRFNNIHVREKHWKIWRNVMPKVLQARAAREFHKKRLLGKCLDAWVKTYRTKVALKAIARARYLRLPTATAPKPSSLTSFSRAPSRASLSSKSLRSTSPAPVSVATDSKPLWPSKYLSRKSKSVQESVQDEEAENRALTPASAESRPVRSNLWTELKTLRRRSSDATRG